MGRVAPFLTHGVVGLHKFHHAHDERWPTGSSAVRHVAAKTTRHTARCERSLTIKSSIHLSYYKKLLVLVLSFPQSAETGSTVL